MITSIYALSLLASIIGLTGWFHLQNRDSSTVIFRVTFVIGFLTYVLSVLFVDASIQDKLYFLCRDLAILSIFSFALGQIIKNKTLFVAITSLFLGGFYFMGFDYLKSTYKPRTEFPQSFLRENARPAKAASNTAIPKLDSEGEILLQLKEGKEINTIKDLVKRYNFKMTKAFYPKHKEWTRLDDYYLLDIPKEFEAKAETILKELSRSDAVEWVEGNEIVNIERQSKPIPTKKSRNFGINDKEQNRLWGFEKMEVQKLYKLLKQSKYKPKKKALIAICDTGVSGKHEDLKANYRSINRAYDSDRIGHGTHCAGIAAAVTNNKKGIASFSPNNDYVEVTSIKVMNSFGVGSQQKIISGIIEAADNDAAVISLSLGGVSNQARQKAYNDVVKYATKKGAIVVAAAGNSKANAKNYCPANAAGIITVAAIDTVGNKANFSNSVQDIKMGVAAPGVAIYSTIQDNKYAAMNGTSMATPYVAGLLGIMKSLKPKLTAKEAFGILEKSGLNSNQPKETGKIIYPHRAVEELMK